MHRKFFKKMKLKTKSIALLIEIISLCSFLIFHLVNAQSSFKTPNLQYLLLEARPLIETEYHECSFFCEKTETKFNTNLQQENLSRNDLQLYETLKQKRCIPWNTSMPIQTCRCEVRLIPTMYEWLQELRNLLHSNLRSLHWFPEGLKFVTQILPELSFLKESNDVEQLITDFLDHRNEIYKEINKLNEMIFSFHYGRPLNHNHFNTLSKLQSILVPTENNQLFLNTMRTLMLKVKTKEVKRTLFKYKYVSLLTQYRSEMQKVPTLRELHVMEAEAKNQVKKVIAAVIFYFHAIQAQLKKEKALFIAIESLPSQLKYES